MVRFLASSWPIIALAFPLLELAGIIYIWHQIGVWTLLWLLVAVLAGSSLIAAERLTFMPRLVGVMMGGENPFAALKGSGLRFLAGVLLIFPGIISDVIAVVLLLWSLAQPEPMMKHWPADGEPREDDVIEGEFRRMD
jgi:UPF0716 protein FxsA